MEPDIALGGGVRTREAYEYPPHQETKSRTRANPRSAVNRARIREAFAETVEGDEEGTEIAAGGKDGRAIKTLLRRGDQ